MHEEGGRVCGIAASLVWVVHGSETSESGLDVAVGRVEGHAKVGIVGGHSTLIIVGLEDGVGQVDGYDEDVDGSAVRVESCRARGGLRVAGADGDAIVNGLYP